MARTLMWRKTVPIHPPLPDITIQVCMTCRLVERRLMRNEPDTQSRDTGEKKADIRALAELVGLATRLNEARSLDSLLSRFASGLADIWPGAGVRMCEVDIDARCLIPIDSMAADPIPLRGSLLGNTATDRECVVVDDLDEHPAYMRGREAPPGLVWKRAIACPVPLEENPTHVVAVFLPEKNQVTDADRALMERAVMLLESLLTRWRSQETQLDAFLSIARAIASAVDARDPHLVGHGERVCEFAQAIARVHGLESNFIKRLGLAGLLHDIGRLGIPESILSKPGPLTPGEIRVIRAHPELSVRFLEKVDYLSDVFSSIRHHHERYDGDGYPDGLEGEDIPLGARIIAIADAFDAMTSPRPFRAAQSDRQAIDELIVNKGTQFDPILVESFIRACEDKLIISQNVLKADDPLAKIRNIARS